MAKRVRGWQGAKPYTLFVPDGNLGEDCTPVIVQNAQIVSDQALLSSTTDGELVRFAYNIDVDNTTFGPVVNLDPGAGVTSRAELDKITFNFSIAATTDEFPPFIINVDSIDLSSVVFDPGTIFLGIPIINPNGCTAYLEFALQGPSSPGVL